MPTSLPRRLLVVLTVSAATLATTVASTSPAGADERPTAVVAMGDSFISGEAAGSYDPATDTATNRCHRSRVSEIAMTAIADIDARINLACSGAMTLNVELGGAALSGEAPQAEQLRAVARSHRVKMIVLNVGANDLKWAALMRDCVEAYFRLGPRCQDIWADQMSPAFELVELSVSRSITHIRTVMGQAGYTGLDYQLVLQTYASPITENSRYSWSKVFHGCPFRDDDAQWTRDVAIPKLTAMFAKIAGQSKVRLLDLGMALRGREVCTRHVGSSAQEWARGVVVDLEKLRRGGLPVSQESLHPTALAHAQFGRCLTLFYALPVNAARCMRQADGTLSPVPVELSELTRHVVPRTLPRVEEPPPPENQVRELR